MAWNKNRQGSKGPMKVQPFWITCPKCKEKIAAPMEWVFKYLDRIGWEAEPKQDH